MTEKIGRSFDRRAARYDNPVTAFIGERELRVIRRFVPTGSRVLDYGCGTGRSALDHARRGCTVTAYDLSAQMMSRAETRAREMGLEVEFTSSVQQLSGRKWPLVTCIGVLDYYPDPQPLLIELKQFLELDGKLVVTFPNAWSPMGWVYFLLSRFTTPARPSFAGFVQRRAGDCGLVVSAVSYAFPPVHLIGYTVVMELRPRG